MKRRILVFCMVLLIALCCGMLFACSLIDDTSEVVATASLRDDVLAALQALPSFKDVTMIDESVTATVEASVTSIDLSSSAISEGIITIYEDEARQIALRSLTISEGVNTFYLTASKGEVSEKYVLKITRKSVESKNEEKEEDKENVINQDGNGNKGEEPETITHTHTFADVWSKDETYHWHAATCEHSERIKDKALHVWDEGEITTPATQEAEGVKCYSCTVCGAVKKEAIERLKKPGEGLVYALMEDDTYRLKSIGTCTDTDLVIPSIYENKPVTSIADYAFYYCDFLKSVTIPSSITSMGNGVFAECSGLSSVSISDGVTHIGESAFSNCGSLTEIVIPPSVSDIGNRAFYNTGLVSVTIASTEISVDSSAFYGCAIEIANIPTSAIYAIPKDNLKTIVIEGGTAIAEAAFRDRESLTSVTIGSSVTEIGNWAFGYCTNMTSLTISNSVTTIGEHAFSSCYGITEINIPNNATNIGEHAFSDCTGLTEITIPETWTTLEEGVFSGCTGLTEVTIPATIKRINYAAFYSCRELRSVTIEKDSLLASVSNLVFYDCEKLSSITMGAGGLKYHTAGNCLIDTEEKTLVLGCTGSVIPSDGSVTIIGAYAFYGCWGLTAITIPASVERLEEYAFHDCSALASVTFDEGIEYLSIGRYAFQGCDILTHITIPSCVKYIGDCAFRYSGLVSVTIGSGVWIIDEGVFSNCDELSSITLSDGVAVFDKSAFWCCSSLTSITIPQSVNTFGDYAFGRCSNLTSIIYKGTIAQWEAISKSSTWDIYIDTYTVHCLDGDVEK